MAKLLLKSGKPTITALRNEFKKNFILLQTEPEQAKATVTLENLFNAVTVFERSKEGTGMQLTSKEYITELVKLFRRSFLVTAEKEECVFFSGLIIDIVHTDLVLKRNETEHDKHKSSISEVLEKKRLAAAQKQELLIDAEIQTRELKQIDKELFQELLENVKALRAMYLSNNLPSNITTPIRKIQVQIIA